MSQSKLINLKNNPYRLTRFLLTSERMPKCSRDCLLQFYYSKYLTMEAKILKYIHALSIGMSCINTFVLDYDATSLDLF